MGRRQHQPSIHLIIYTSPTPTSREWGRAGPSFHGTEIRYSLMRNKERRGRRACFQFSSDVSEKRMRFAAMSVYREYLVCVCVCSHGLPDGPFALDAKTRDVFTFSKFQDDCFTQTRGLPSLILLMPGLLSGLAHRLALWTPISSHDLLISSLSPLHVRHRLIKTAALLSAVSRTCRPNKRARNAVTLAPTSSKC